MKDDELKQGVWAKDDLRRAFVEGACWWLWHTQKMTPFGSERDVAEAEAERRYPEGRPLP